MLVLFVPLVTIMLLYLHTESIVKGQISVSERNTLNSFCQGLDATAEEIQLICVSLANNTECQIYARYCVYSPEKTVFQAYETKQLLANFPAEKYYDIMVYYPYADRIISNSKASLDMDCYYASYYGGGEDFREEFREILNCDSKRAGFYVMNGDSPDSWLCIAMRVAQSRDERLDYVVVIVLRPSWVREMMTVQNEDVTMIFNEKGELLLSGTGDGVEYHLGDWMGEEGPYETEFGGDEYMMQVQESGVLGGYYAVAVPFDYFWHQLSHLRLTCGLGGLACVIISITIAFKLTRRTYRPIGNMISMLQKKSDLSYDRKSDNEFEYIAALFDRESEENRMLSREVRKGKQMKREQFLFSLLTGSRDGDSAGDDIFMKNGIVLCSNCFFVGIILVEQEEVLEAELLTFVVQNIFQELCNREHKGYVVILADGRFAVLVNPKEAVWRELTDVLQEGKAFLKQYYHLKLTIGTSRVHEGVAGIRMAYEEAELALKYRCILGPGKVIDYEQIAGREFRYLSGEDSRISRMVMGYMTDGAEVEAPERFAAKLMDLYGIDERASLETAEYFRMETVSAVNKAIMSVGYTSESRKHMVKELLSRAVMYDFMEYFAYVLTTLRQKAQEQAQQKDVCKRAMEYIHENFGNPQLSVAMLGEELKISASYLSRLFKEKYGVSLPDCISGTRIQNAKQALRHSEKSIREIAGENGFLSSNAFIKTFKKQEGITPGVYRNLM